MMSALDDSVGNVTRALHQRGMLNNTIIIFSTDNGGPADGFDFNDASNWPLRCVGVYVLAVLFLVKQTVVCSSVAMSCHSSMPVLSSVVPGPRLFQLFLPPVFAINLFILSHMKRTISSLMVSCFACVLFTCP